MIKLHIYDLFVDIEYIYSRINTDEKEFYTMTQLFEKEEK